MTDYTSTQIRPYVYHCTHKTTGEFYIGYREQNVKLGQTADLDFPQYKTSLKRIQDSFDEFDWHIVAEFFSGDDAYDFEQQLIYENWGDSLLLNRSCFHKKSRFNHSNTKHSEATKKKMSQAKLGIKRKPFTAETKRKMSETWKAIAPDRSGEKNGMHGKKHTEESKRKMSITHTGKKIGPYPTIECPHCSKNGSVNNMKRWHFDNCKQKEKGHD